MFHLKTVSIQLFWILEGRQRKWLSWEIKQKTVFHSVNLFEPIYLSLDSLRTHIFYYLKFP